MPIKLPSFRPRRDVYPPDLWTKCPSCSEMLFNKQLQKADRICPTCDHHFRLSAMARLAMLIDPGTFLERDPGLQSVDPLRFVDQKAYPDRVATAQTQTGLRDAAVRGIGAIEGMPVSICVMDFGFMGGSMGAVVGEKVTRAAEDSLTARIPLIVVSASGGARMQEGTLALMQLAKTCAILERLRAARVPYVSVMSDPTTGGVFASYAVLGDVNLAEPKALIGFAGARVSAGTIAQELPPGFQRSEFLFEHGFIDRIIHRRALRGEIASVLRFMRAPELTAVETTTGPIGTFLSSVVGVASGAVGVASGAAGGIAGAAGGIVGAAAGAVAGSAPGNGNGGDGGNAGAGSEHGEGDAHG
jgi:acetyl-CoA carboxylase carboxyl transferase subunit beta